MCGDMVRVKGGDVGAGEVVVVVCVCGDMVRVRGGDVGAGTA